jgi:hypothetical protein
MSTRGDGGLIAQFVPFPDGDEPPGNGRWVKAAVVAALALIGVLFILGATGLVPFLYALW